MTLPQIRKALLWCTVINFGVLIVWSLLMLNPHEWLHQIWLPRFRISAEQFDLVSFQGIVLYKSLTLIFNLVPLVALCFVGERKS
ncbi:MAG TPA: hypothetical protein VNC50_11650 [Planctomycetia bacterium]|nr:hypothetical protein [Planctomycetia bacterium]